MFREIGEKFSSEWVSIGSTIMLWLFITNEKAIETARAKPTRYLFYVWILGYYLILIIEIIVIIIRNIG